MAEDQLTSYWIDQAQQGGALPPEEIEDLDALPRRLRQSGIGYAARQELGDHPPAGLKLLPLDRRPRWRPDHGDVSVPT
jgi:hypothetical protein